MYRPTLCANRRSVPTLDLEVEPEKVTTPVPGADAKRAMGKVMWTGDTENE